MEFLSNGKGAKTKKARGMRGPWESLTGCGEVQPWTRHRSGKRHHQPSDVVADRVFSGKASKCFIPFKEAPQTLFVKLIFSHREGLRRRVDITRSPFHCFITL